MTEAAASLEDRNKAYSTAVPHGSIEGLFTFHGAATILRISRSLGELDVSVVVGDDAVEDKDEILQSFFKRLALVEQSLLSRNALEQVSSESQVVVHSVVVAVEGLDGSGKSSLVQGLTESLSHRQQNGDYSTDDVTCVAWATPTHSMAQVRPVFDKRGGPVARAFYLVSNYFLQFDVQQLERQIKRQQQGNQKCRLFVVVDRWYTSTVAYSVAWKNTSGSAHSVDALDSTIFAWPPDLRTPDLLFLLQVDDMVRRERVHHRNNLDYNNNNSNNNNFNPWDQRLNDDTLLGQRIRRAFDRVADENLAQEQTIRLNANQTQEKVLQDALRAIDRYISPRHDNALSCAVKHRNHPLDLFRSVSSELRLCDESTGRRRYHAPWACQLAWIHNQFPLMKTVGIHTVDSSGVIFFMRRDHRTPRPSSFVCVVGEYPNEHQWRGEGMIIPVESSECQCLDLLPPPSLVAYTTACSECEGDKEMLLQQRLQDRAETLRNNPCPFDQVLQGYRFVPLRMEVLIGGPSSPGGPLRYEWHRPSPDAAAIALSENWSSARLILPFRAPNTSMPSPFSWKPVTVCITGTHCAGKTTLGKRVAKILGWRFQTELGQTLRDESNLVAGGHRTGNGSGDGTSNSSSWDDQLYHAEMQRDGNDADDRCCRVVETWHIGNLEWALMRLRARKDKSPAEEDLVVRTKSAFQAELKRAVVIAVHLKVGPEDSLRRRVQEKTNQARIPMVSERDELTELHQSLDVQAQQHLAELQKELDFPYLLIENSDDGALDVMAKRIVRFINEQQWRRAA